MRRRTLFGALAACAFPVVLLAQSAVAPQIEQSREFQGALAPVDQDQPGGSPTVEMLDGSAFYDDSFGAQVMLKRQDKPQRFSAFTEIGAFATNNVAFTREDTEIDSFMVAAAGFGFSQPLLANLRFDAGARFSIYRYDRFRELDFQSTDLGAGLAWAPAKLKGAEIFLRYSFTNLTTADTLGQFYSNSEDFYTNHSVLLGVQKAVPLTRAQALFGGVSGQWSFTDPQPAGRDEYAAYIGYQAQLARDVGLNLLYRYSRYIYEADNRKDNGQTLSFGMQYNPADCVSLSATSYYGWNRSNFEVFDYNVANAGLSLQFSVRF